MEEHKFFYYIPPENIKKTNLTLTALNLRSFFNLYSPSPTPRDGGGGTPGKDATLVAGLSKIELEYVYTLLINLSG